MGLTFQEKSLWLMSISLVVGFGLYFGAVVVLQIVGHVVIAVFDRRSETDERGRLIGLKGTRNGAWVLATGVFFALCAALLTPGNFVFTHVARVFAVPLEQVFKYGEE